VVAISALATYISQARAAWESNVSAVYRFVFELLDSKIVRDARHLVYELNPETHNEEYWSKLLPSDPTRAAADLTARKFDQLGLLVREGVVPVNVVARFYASPILRCWYNLQPFVGHERKKRKPPQQGHLWEWENLVFDVIMPSIRPGKGVWSGALKHDQLEDVCDKIESQRISHAIMSDKDYRPANNFWVLKPRHRIGKKPW
jgi:hypothetical protein